MRGSALPSAWTFGSHGRSASIIVSQVISTNKYTEYPVHSFIARRLIQVALLQPVTESYSIVQNHGCLEVFGVKWILETPRAEKPRH